MRATIHMFASHDNLSPHPGSIKDKLLGVEPVSQCGVPQPTGGPELKELTADGVFAFACLLASIFYSAAGDTKQALFFIGCALVFVAKDLASNDTGHSTQPESIK
jgi:hypothetical protein